MKGTITQTRNYRGGLGLKYAGEAVDIDDALARQLEAQGFFVPSKPSVPVSKHASTDAEED